LPVTQFPFRVGLDSRGPRAVARIVMDRRRLGSRSNNDLYLAEREATNVSQHSRSAQQGAYVLVDRQSTCGTLVEGRVVGGKRAAARALRDSDASSSAPSSARVQFRAG
jgi:hypothetical protein